MQAVKDALPNFVLANHPDSEYFVAVISSQPQLSQDWTKDVTALVNSLPAISKKTTFSGSTAMYDACFSGIQKLMSSSHRKRVLVLISDGQDSSSKHTFRELERLLDSSDVVFYAVGSVSREESSVSALGMEALGILDELSFISGGRSIYPNKVAEIGKALQDVVADFRSQYAVTIQVDANAKRAKRHPLKVKLTPTNSSDGMRNLKVRSRLSYYSE